MIASLPMYDRPETRAANDAFWSAIRAELGYGPAALERKRDLWQIWQDPDLVLSQTCGMPYRTRLHDKVTLVGTPDYALPGLAPGYYQSIFLTRRGESADLRDYRDRRFAYNDAGSQSGWSAAQTHAQKLGFSFRNLLCTGAHRASALAIAEGRADIAALDAVSWRMIRQFDGFAADLVETAVTDPTPGLPLITARDRPAEPILNAVRKALDRLPEAHATRLGIGAIVTFAPADYMAIATPAGP